MSDKTYGKQCTLQSSWCSERNHMLHVQEISVWSSGFLARWLKPFSSSSIPDDVCCKVYRKIDEITTEKLIRTHSCLRLSCLRPRQRTHVHHDRLCIGCTNDQIGNEANVVESTQHIGAARLLSPVVEIMLEEHNYRRLG